MPYISAEDYKRVKHLIAPEMPKSTHDLRGLETRIYALNRKIRAHTGSGPTPEWKEFMVQHRKLLDVYFQAGGNKFYGHGQVLANEKIGVPDG